MSCSLFYSQPIYSTDVTPPLVSFWDDISNEWPAWCTVNGEHENKHFMVAVFVVCEGRFILHLHRKRGMRLPPGGHIEMHRPDRECCAPRTALDTATLRSA
jgi:hypothetical protein